MISLLQFHRQALKSKVTVNVVVSLMQHQKKREASIQDLVNLSFSDSIYDAVGLNNRNLKPC